MSSAVTTKEAIAGAGYKLTQTPPQFLKELKKHPKECRWILQQVQRLKRYMDRDADHSHTDWLNAKEKELTLAMRHKPGYRLDVHFKVPFVVNLNHWLKSALNTKEDMSWALMLYALNQAVSPTGDLDKKHFALVTCGMTITENRANVPKGNAKVLPKAFSCMLDSRAELISRGRKLVSLLEDQRQEPDDAQAGEEIAPVQEQDAQESIAEVGNLPSDVSLKLAAAMDAVIQFRIEYLGRHKAPSKEAIEVAFDDGVGPFVDAVFDGLEGYKPVGTTAQKKAAMKSIASRITGAAEMLDSWIPCVRSGCPAPTTSFGVDVAGDRLRFRSAHSGKDLGKSHDEGHQAGLSQDGEIRLPAIKRSKRIRDTGASSGSTVEPGQKPSARSKRGARGGASARSEGRTSQSDSPRAKSVRRKASGNSG